jgi:hypothetical protein
MMRSIRFGPHHLEACRFVVADPIHPIDDSTLCTAHQRATEAPAIITSRK